MKIDFKKITEELKPTFDMAGLESINLYKKGLKIEIKEDGSPVSNGDLKVNELIIKKIKDLTPNIPVISEETVNLKEKNKNSIFWLIDPIDGTKEYISGKDEYTLNAALIIDLKPALGMVYAPEKNRLFYSYGKNLAFEINNGKKIVLDCKKKHSSKIIGLESSRSTSNEVLEIYKKYKVSQIIKMSSSLKFCVLAAGEADIYAAKARAWEWDIAAGHAVLEHSGGSITTHDEKKFLYGKKNYKNLPIIAKRAASLEK